MPIDRLALSALALVLLSSFDGDVKLWPAFDHQVLKSSSFLLWRQWLRLETGVVVVAVVHKPQF